MSFKSNQQSELRDTLSVASHLYTRGSTLLHCGGNDELKLFTTEIFQLINTKSERSSCLQILASMLRIHQAVGLEGRLLSLIDSIPSFIESSVTEFDGVGVVDFIEAILDCGSQELHGRLASNLTKILSASVHMTNKPSVDINAIGFAIINAFTGANNNTIRHSLLLHSSQLISACTHRLDHPQLCERAATTLAGFYSIESGDLWAAAWLRHCEQLEASLSPLEGIVHIHHSATTSSSSSSSSSSSGNVTVANTNQKVAHGKKGSLVGSSGFSSAAAIERAFRGQCLLLSKVCVLSYYYLHAT